MNEHELDDRLRRLTDRMDSPSVPLADDLTRGRRLVVRRRRRVLGGAALATAAILGLGAVVGPGLGGSRTDAGPAGGGGTTPTGPDVTPSVEPGETELPSADATDGPAGPPNAMPGATAGDRELYVGIRRATAAHLDPDGTHISQREIRQANQSGSSGEGGWTAIVQKIGWQNPGEDGLGLVTVGVRTSFDVDCGGHGPGGPSATCTDTELAGTPVTRVDDEYEGTYHAYRRPDGYVTTIGLSDLFGNSSTVAVSGIDVTDAQLAAVLTDPALDIPGHPAPVTPDVLDGTVLRDAARSVLGDVGEESWAGQVGGYWSGTAAGVEVMLTDGQGNLDMDAPCPTWFATRCVTRETEAGTVRIDHRRNKNGGGFDVTLDGAERMIWVYVKQRGGVSVDLAVELATDPRLQE